MFSFTIQYVNDVLWCLCNFLCNATSMPCVLLMKLAIIVYITMHLLYYAVRQNQYLRKLFTGISLKISITGNYTVLLLSYCCTVYYVVVCYSLVLTASWLNISCYMLDWISRDYLKWCQFTFLKVLHNFWIKTFRNYLNVILYLILCFF